MDKLVTQVEKGYKGNFGYLEKRFKSSDMIDELPGPGTYQPNIAADDQNVCQEPSYIFKSKVRDSRFPNKFKKEELRPSFVTYKMDYYNIEKKCSNPDDLDPELKINRPAFSTAAKRFTQYKIPEVPNDDEDSIVYF